LPNSGERIAVGGPVDLAIRLAALPDSAQCFACKWLEFAIERDIMPEHEGSLRAAASAFTSAALNVRALIGGVARTRVFLAPR